VDADRLRPLCRTVEDCALVFHAIAKADDRIRRDRPPVQLERRADVRKLRVEPGGGVSGPTQC
jgi:Asp-tRNA(Asn)/Glu-tRNA(Gln) amidotransferase A subunit family amidase